MTAGEDWNAYKKLVMSELDRISSRIGLLEKKIDLLRGDVIMLKIKSGVWGLMAGLIPVTIAMIAKAI
jgi:hypothetical protein|tara:strand:+ start:117 stop:320 length:204 start_codon:yes stop_codon:yes gene_type:complete